MGWPKKQWLMYRIRFVIYLHRQPEKMDAFRHYFSTLPLKMAQSFIEHPRCVQRFALIFVITI